MNDNNIDNETNGQQTNQDDWNSPVLHVLAGVKKYFKHFLFIFAVAFTLCWIFRNELTALIKWPLLQAFPDTGAETIFLRVIDAFMMHVKISFYFSMLIVLPFISFLVVKKSSDKFSLKNNSGIKIGLSMIFLFYLGVGFAYFIAMPAAFNFLVQYSMDDSGMIFSGKAMGFADDLQISMREHVDLTMKMLIAFGLGFESPLAMLVSTKSGLVTTETFKKHRGTALVVLAIFSSVLTPPDPWTMVLLLLPMYILYEVGILLCKNRNSIAGKE